MVFLQQVRLQMQKSSFCDTQKETMFSHHKEKQTQCTYTARHGYEFCLRYHQHIKHVNLKKRHHYETEKNNKNSTTTPVTIVTLSFNVNSANILISMRMHALPKTKTIRMPHKREQN